MFVRRVLLFIAVIGFCRPVAYAQGDDFCEAVTAVTLDAPNQFRNIRGKLKESNAMATIWAAGIKVPGSIGVRFVKSMGLFYECAFYQTRNKAEIAAVYHKYKGMLKDCLVAQGYTMTEQPNFYSGLGEYKKLVFTTELKDDVKADNAPSHTTLEATFNKDIGLYTIVLFIFEH